MTPADFNCIRHSQGLSIAQIARILRVADRSTVHRWATGERNISGPASILLELLDRGELPGRYLTPPRDTRGDSDGDDGA